MSSTLSFLEVVVVHLYHEHNETTAGRDKIGQKESPENIWLMEEPLQHKAESSYSHHQERGKGYTIGIACPNGFDSLRQIAQNHRDTCQPAANLKNNTLFHNGRFTFI